MQYITYNKYYQHVHIKFRHIVQKDFLEKRNRCTSLDVSEINRPDNECDCLPQYCH